MRNASVYTLYYFIATDVYLRKYNKYIVYRDIFYGVRVAVDAYSVTIGDYETPGMELAPGFWVKNDDMIIIIMTHAVYGQ